MPRRWIGLLFASASNCAKCNIVRTDNYPRLCLCLRHRRRLCLSVCLSAKIQGCSLSRTLPRSKRFKVLHTPQKHPGLSCQLFVQRTVGPINHMSWRSKREAALCRAKQRGTGRPHIHVRRATQWTLLVWAPAQCHAAEIAASTEDHAECSSSSATAPLADGQNNGCARCVHLLSTESATAAAVPGGRLHHLRSGLLRAIHMHCLYVEFASKYLCICCIYGIRTPSRHVLATRPATSVANSKPEIFRRRLSTYSVKPNVAVGNATSARARQGLQD